jgi:single-strand DNA-binding protein
MNGLNKVQFIGNLGQDPNVMNFENGGSKAEFSIATQDGYKDQTGAWQTVTDWHRCYATGKLAETVAQYFNKGMRVFIEGKLKTRSWKNDAGATQYITEVRVTDFMFLSSKNDNAGGGQATTSQTQKSQTDLPSQKEDDDLPF